MWLRIHRLEYENILKYLSSQFWISWKIFANMRMYSAKWCNFSISQVTQELLNSLQIFFSNKIFKSLWDKFTVWIRMSQQLLNIMLSDTYDMGLQDFLSPHLKP